MASQEQKVEQKEQKVDIPWFPMQCEVCKTLVFFHVKMDRDQHQEDSPYCSEDCEEMSMFNMTPLSPPGDKFK